MKRIQELGIAELVMILGIFTLVLWRFSAAVEARADARSEIKLEALRGNGATIAAALRRKRAELAPLKDSVATKDAAVGRTRTVTDRTVRAANTAATGAQIVLADPAAPAEELRAQLVVVTESLYDAIARIEAERIVADAAIAARDSLAAQLERVIAAQDSLIANRDATITVLEDREPSWWRRVLGSSVTSSCAAGGAAVGALVGGIGGAAIGGGGAALVCLVVR